MPEPTIFELSSSGRTGVTFPEPEVPLTELPQEFARARLPFPEISEMGVVRHFTRLSQKNYAVDLGLYPLGSCTMKYNPKINEVTCRYPGFANTHPLQPEHSVQGNLYLMYTLQQWLAEIGGFADATLEPAAGAQGELVGTLIINKYHADRGDHGQCQQQAVDDGGGKRAIHALTPPRACGPATAGRW